MQNATSFVPLVKLYVWWKNYPHMIQSSRHYLLPYHYITKKKGRKTKKRILLIFLPLNPHLTQTALSPTNGIVLPPNPRARVPVSVSIGLLNHLSRMSSQISQSVNSINDIQGFDLINVEINKGDRSWPPCWRQLFRHAFSQRRMTAALAQLNVLVQPRPARGKLLALAYSRGVPPVADVS